MCNCASDVQTRAKEKISSQLPEGSRDLLVELEGYAFLLGSSVSMKNKLNLHVEYEAPKKNGGFTRKKQNLSMIGTYCMFCGDKYDKDEAQAVQP